MDSSELLELYQDIILDHNKRPRNFEKMENPTHAAHGHNPLCGDEVNVYVKLVGDRIEGLSFDGEGCAISKASASLMTEVLKGKTLDEVKAQSSRLYAMLEDDAEEVDLAELLMEEGDLAALSGVKKFPARIKCATLSWHALDAALAGQGKISTEGEGVSG